MFARYDFGEKLDLSKFRKQVTFYVGKYSHTEYNIFTKDFKILFTTEPAEDGSILARISTSSIVRDADGEMILLEHFRMSEDSRFESFKEALALFNKNYHRHLASFNSKSPKDIVDKVCGLIKIFHKVNSLIAFS